jgi:ABC-type transporter Mla MlaB component
MATSPPSTITFAIRGPLARDDLPALYSRVCLLLTQSGARAAVCDVAGVAADAVSVDALARLQLAARRHRCRMELTHASDDLRDLIAFMGLEDVLAV